MSGRQRGAADSSSNSRPISSAASGIVRPTLNKATSRALRQFQLEWAKFVRDRAANNADPANARISLIRQRDCLTPQLLEGLASCNVFESFSEDGTVQYPGSVAEVTSRMVSEWLRRELQGDVDHFNKAAYEARMNSVTCSSTEALRVLQLLVDYQNALADMYLQQLVETSTKSCIKEVVDKLRPASFREHVNTVLHRQKGSKKRTETSLRFG
jgi:hypothetical protein